MFNLPKKLGLNPLVFKPYKVSPKKPQCLCGTEAGGVHTVTCDECAKKIKPTKSKKKWGTPVPEEFIGVDLAKGKSRTVRTVWNKQKVDDLMALITESFPKKENRSELEDYMVDLVDEYFPKGDTSRGKAIVMMSRLFIKATSLETVEKRLKLWVKNHGDVFQRGLNSDGVPLTDHWWYVQNCLGDIFGWSNEIGDILEKVELPAPYIFDSCPHIISKKDQKRKK